MSYWNSNFELMNLDNVYIDIWLAEIYWRTVLCIVKLHLRNQCSETTDNNINRVSYNAFASEK